MLVLSSEVGGSWFELRRSNPGGTWQLRSAKETSASVLASNTSSGVTGKKGGIFCGQPSCWGECGPAQRNLR